MHPLGASSPSRKDTSVPPALFRVTRRRRSRLVAALATVGVSAAVLVAAAQTASASPLGDAAANLAAKNAGRTACGTNTLGGHGYYSSCVGDGGYPEQWCADFAKWVWANNGALVDGLDARAGTFYTYGQRYGTLHTASSYRPVPGDAVVYGYVGNSAANHVGIVTRVYGDGGYQSANGNFGDSASTSQVELDNTPAGRAAVGSSPAGFPGQISGYISPKPGPNAPVDTPVWPSLAEPGRITSARSDDGRLEVFASSADGVSHAWQTSVNGKWSAWRNEGGPANAQLSIARNIDGRLELFALNGSKMMHKYQLKPSGEWSDWETDFGPTGGDYVVAGNNADGRIEVFASNSTGVVHKYQTGATTWSAWEGFPGGGPADAKLQLERSPDGRIELFAMNSKVFWHTYQTKPSGGWAPWETNFGGGGDNFTIDHNSDGRLEVFASSYAGVFHNYQKTATTWNGWEPMNGPTGSPQLSTTRNDDGRVELFTMGAGNAQHLFQKAPNQPYGAWETNFGGPGTQVQAVNDQDGRIEIFGASSAGVFHKYQTGFSTWSQWETLNGTNGPSIP